MGRAGNPSLQRRPAPASYRTHGTMVSVEEKFSQFHQAHPEICSALVCLAREAKARGSERYSMRTIYSVLRFQIAVGEKPHDYAIDDRLMVRGFIPLYIELIRDACPDLKGLFRSRTRRRSPAIGRRTGSASEQNCADA
jgi:hypothetical protein